MPKMTKEELAKRKSEMAARARVEVAKTEIVQFRVDADSIEKLYEHAAALKMPIGTMVRQWVLERLAAEERSEEKSIQQDYLDSLASLHAKLDYWAEIDINEKVELVALSATKSLRANAERDYSLVTR